MWSQAKSEMVFDFKEWDKGQKYWYRDYIRGCGDKSEGLKSIFDHGQESTFLRSVTFIFKRYRDTF